MTKWRHPYTFSLPHVNMRRHRKQMKIRFGDPDHAMANTVEISPAATSSANRSFGKQRTETWCRQRDNVPVKSGKAHDTASGSGLVQAGNGGREKGATQKFLNGSLNQLEN